ncbi:hypothetical protein E2P81_ATG02469 [Venturia nashicola]|nr:hypothetical protein E2P81_ATG02469 [Venturia nashicola]
MPALRKRFPLDLSQDEKSSTKLFVDLSVNNLWKWDRRDLRTNEVDTIGLVFHTRDIALDFAVCVSNLPGRSRCSSEMNAAMRINFSIKDPGQMCVAVGAGTSFQTHHSKMRHNFYPQHWFSHRSF